MEKNIPVREKKSVAAAAKPPARKTNGARKQGDESNWDQYLGFLMHDVSRLRRAVFDDFVKPMGVTRSQWWVLAHLARHDGMIQSDLADILDLGKAALGGLIDRLELSGLIERRPDDVDRRVKRVFVTSKGAQLVKQMLVKSNEMSELILNGLAPSQRQELADLLSLVKKNLLSLQGASKAE